MSQEIDLRKDSGDDDGEWPNTASAPPLSLSRKRRRHEDVGSEDAQILVDHHESHEGIAVAVSRPMTLDLELTSRNNGSADKCSQKRMTLKTAVKLIGTARERFRLGRPFERAYRLSKKPRALQCS
jgi:hypothetical protein